MASPQKKCDRIDLVVEGVELAYSFIAPVFIFGECYNIMLRMLIQDTRMIITACSSPYLSTQDACDSELFSFVYVNLAISHAACL